MHTTSVALLSSKTGQAPDRQSRPAHAVLVAALSAVVAWSPASAVAGTAHFVPNNLLPPPTGMDVSTQQTYTSFANGVIVIRNLAHRNFSESVSPPTPTGPVTHSFSSQVEYEISTDGGQTWQTYAGNGNMTVKSTLDSVNGATQIIAAEVLAFEYGGPNGILVRENPSLQSNGQIAITQVPGGFMIDSFFDIFTEVSIDGGANWSPVTNGPLSVVLDAPPPPDPLQLNAPPNQWVLAPSPAGAVVNYPAPTTTGGLAPITVMANPPSGSTFPIGTTTVSCNAFDSLATAFSTSSPK